jgi:sec-independent protein translocase protein TatB
MFDFDFGKLMVVAIVALAVIPPKDLPRVMRTVGQVVGKMRRMAAEFQGQFMDAMREADLESVRKELDALNEQAKVNTAFDPATMIRDDLKKAVEGPTQVKTALIALDEPQPAAPAERPAAEPEPKLVSVDASAEIEARDASAENLSGQFPSSVGTPPAEPSAPVEAHHPVEAPAKQSAAE